MLISTWLRSRSLPSTTFWAMRSTISFWMKALQRTRSEDGIVAVDGQVLHRRRRHVERDAAVGQTVAHFFQLQIDDRLDVRHVQRVEHHHVIDAVDELGAERRAQGAVDGLLHSLLVAVLGELADELRSTFDA